jgi:hypothetical protein
MTHAKNCIERNDPMHWASLVCDEDTFLILCDTYLTMFGEKFLKERLLNVDNTIHKRHVIHNIIIRSGNRNKNKCTNKNHNHNNSDNNFDNNNDASVYDCKSHVNANRNNINVENIEKQNKNTYSLNKKDEKYNEYASFKKMTLIQSPTIQKNYPIQKQLKNYN